MFRNLIDRSANVSTQLKRLEKGIIPTEVSRRSHIEGRSGRRTKLIRRFKGEKENMSIESMQVTSQQLRGLGEDEEELREVLLVLQRFYEKQRDDNQ